VLGFYSKHDRVLGNFVPSMAAVSYNTFVKIAGDAIARMLAWPFPELFDLPPIISASV
jgi:hypothetical protein